MDDDELVVVRHLFEGAGDRLLARGSPLYDAHRLAKLFPLHTVFPSLDFVGAGSQNDVGDEFAGCEAAKSVEEDGCASELKELLGGLSAHAGAHGWGGKDGGDSAHLMRRARNFVRGTPRE